jgi:hypothetical protein
MQHTKSELSFSVVGMSESYAKSSESKEIGRRRLRLPFLTVADARMTMDLARASCTGHLCALPRICARSP